jgi:hypothetical protein
VGRGLRGRDDGSNVNNVQYKCNQNCHYESPLYNEYILIIIKKTQFNRKKESSYFHCTQHLRMIIMIEGVYQHNKLSSQLGTRGHKLAKG